MKTTILAAALCALGAARGHAAAFEAGRQLMLERRYPEAVRNLELAAREAPGSPEVLLNLGWAYWHSKRIDDAFRVGSMLVKLDPGSRVSLVFLANTHIERKEYKSAVKLAERALALAPGDHDASMVLARAMFLDGRETSAMTVLEKVIELHPGDRAATFRKASFLSVMGRKHEALSLLDELLAADRDNPAYRRSRARVLAELGRQEDAKNEWKELARRAPDAQALMNLGWAYWKERDLDEAWKIAENLLKLDDRNPVFLRFMSNLEIERMNYPQALRLAQKALSEAPGDRDAELILSKALFRMQREGEAMAILERLVNRYPDNPAVEYRWAEFLARTGRAERSLLHFERLIKADPLNDTYRMTRAMALYETGLFDDAVAVWGALAARKDPHPAALRRLRDDAFNRGAWSEAVSWQKKLIAGSPDDPAGWEKLARIYVEMKRFDKALWAVERAIAADPVPINAYYMRGEVLTRLQDWPGAAAAYRTVLERNPGSLRGLDGLSYVYQAQGLTREALETVSRIESLTSPSVSPFVEIRKAQLLADAGRFKEAERLLKRLSQDKRTVIPILLYHGLSRFERSDAIPRSAFRTQMLALKERGYVALTVSELDRVFQGKSLLPAKPILITFDDGRTDSFENADPVLKETGFRASMFVHTSKLRKTHFHASPSDIARWHSTGRWDMQSHGYQAHDPMPLDAFGRKGHFLPNRMWLASAGRLERLPEYRARVENDYVKAKQNVSDILPGHEVVGFAYPYGDYGQTDYSNTPESAGINQALVRKNYRLAFVQEQYGINTLSSNPTDLRRYEVPRGMTGEALTARLALGDPRVQAELAQAQLYIRAGQLGRAESLYARLSTRGIDEPRLWADRGAAYQKAGDLARAQELFSRAAEAETEKGGNAAEMYRKLLAQSEHAGAPVASAGTQRFSDSDTNAITKTAMRGAGVAGAARLEGWAGEGRYLDRRMPGGALPIRAQEGGLQARWFAARGLQFDGLYTRRAFSQGATGFADVYAAAVSYQLLPTLRIGVRDGMGNVETAAAIRQGRRFHTDGAGLVWDPALTWKASADYDQSRYNDSNLQQDVRLRLMKTLTERIAVGATYLRRDSSLTAVEYFTPRNLRQYMASVSLNQTLGPLSPRTGLALAAAMLQYEAGRGVQSNGTRTVHSMRGVLSLRPVDRATLSVDAQYAQAPTYVSRRVDGTLGISF
ncbi:MAG: tetratricopeptide repeat protein [Elusimicrobia bacterium]|nr:tetratricopeptide repeat protein [Elusimicrobiota bacterium]